MRRIREVLRLKFEFDANQREIAVATGIGRTTVGEYLSRAAEAGITWEKAQGLGDDALERALFPIQGHRDTRRPAPDWAAVDKELRRRGVTLKLLWLEYLVEHPAGYRLTQFCHHFRQWQQASRPPTLRRVRPAGESLEVDYAGMTVTVMDGAAPRQAQIFVAAMACSGYTYAEATWTQQAEDWLTSHVRAFAFFGGVPQKVVPDNLKTGVSHASYYDPVINPGYRDLARHYRVAVLPTRVRKPRDKASAENAVLQVERWVLAPLRNRRFLALADLNKAIAGKLDELNGKPFAPPLEGSRRSLFEQVERPVLKPLPPEPFVVGAWSKAKVNLDYHVAVDGHFYSVPHALVHKRVEVFATPATVAIFHRGERVASHPRSGAKGRHSTLTPHMPKAHQAIAQRTPDRLRAEAAAIGAATALYVDKLLGGRAHPEQGFRSCLGILRLAASHGRPNLEAACQRALTAGALSSRYVERLLKAERQNRGHDTVSDLSLGAHGNVRGSGYYH